MKVILTEIDKTFFTHCVELKAIILQDIFQTHYLSKIQNIS